MKITDEMIEAMRRELKTFKPDDQLRAALTAALAVQTQQGVEVKALEWECGKSGWPKLAVSVVGIYEIWANFDLVTPAPTRCVRCKSVEHAVEVAHSDYETRIRSALVDVPAVESEPAALIEREVLAELAKHKTATGTVCSPLFKSKFGDKVPLFSRPPRSPSNEGWMSIETAPKTGEAILVVGPDKKGGQYFDVQRWPEGWSGEWPVSYMAYAAGGPTHWMHLPTPPLSTRKGSAGDGAATDTKDADHG